MKIGKAVELVLDTLPTRIGVTEEGAYVSNEEIGVSVDPLDVCNATINVIVDGYSDMICINYYSEDDLEMYLGGGEYIRVKDLSEEALIDKIKMMYIESFYTTEGINEPQTV